MTSKDKERKERKGGRLAISKLMMIRGRETKLMDLNLLPAING
jgi:hypothetical protein